VRDSKRVKELALSNETSCGDVVTRSGCSNSEANESYHGLPTVNFDDPYPWPEISSSSSWTWISQLSLQYTTFQLT